MARMPEILITWEYKVYSSEVLSEEPLQELGRDGWEAVSFVLCGSLGVILFKRAIVRAA